MPAHLSFCQLLFFYIIHCFLKSASLHEISIFSISFLLATISSFISRFNRNISFTIMIKCCFLQLCCRAKPILSDSRNIILQLKVTADNIYLFSKAHSRVIFFLLVYMRYVALYVLAVLVCVTYKSCHTVYAVEIC